MANLAVILKKLGKRVTGVDVKETFITDEILKKHRINFQTQFNFLPEKVDLLIYSAAHQGFANPLVQEAKKKGIKIMSQVDFFNKLWSDFSIKVAVSGCHGKTTTASLLSYSLILLNQKPSYLVGAPSFKDKKTEFLGSDCQEKKYFVVEADEYAVSPPDDMTPKILRLTPDWIINTNIDYDHPDVYDNIDTVKKTFTSFFDGRKLVVNLDDKPTREVIRLVKPERLVTYGTNKDADYRIVNWRVTETGSWFRIAGLGEFELSLFGLHNILNATAVISFLNVLGFTSNQIKSSLKDFLGAKRRFELVKKINRLMIFDDYGHHPKEIEKTILAARQRFKKRRIIVIFQPHTYSRTVAFLTNFRESLSLADIAYILPIFASARERKEDFQITSQKLVVPSKKKLIFIDNEESLRDQLTLILRAEDIIITMGAGDVYKVIEKIVPDTLRIKIGH